MTPFGAKLRYFCNKRGISQQDLANTLSISEKMLSAIINGRKQIYKTQILERICNTLGLTEQENKDLTYLAEFSSYKAKISNLASPDAMYIIHQLAHFSDRLTPVDLKELKLVVDDIGERLMT